MCHFVSWVEHKGIVYFLSDDELATPEGRELRQYCECDDDLLGHGAIRKYYNLGNDQGVAKECMDFSNPENFPQRIRKMIKDGKFRRLVLMGYPPLLSASALAEYEKIEQAALAEYEKIEQAALAEYEKIRQAALAEYKKIEQAALVEYEKIEQAAWFSLYANPTNRIKAWR